MHGYACIASEPYENQNVMLLSNKDSAGYTCDGHHAHSVCAKHLKIMNASLIE